MCGIIGYIGDKDAQSILLDCLKKLEYRGYDSCGFAVDSGDVCVYKNAVRVEELKKEAPEFKGKIGVAHTRWATHGAPSMINAHPHLDCTGNIAVVHNGVITNFQELRNQLEEEGHNLASETDTEVIPHLIEKYYDGNLELAVEQAIKDIEGSYAIIVLMKGKPELIAAQKYSTLTIGIGDRENFIASDVPAILGHTDRVVYLEDGDTGVISRNEVKVRRNGKVVDYDERKVAWNVAEAQKGGYEHFLLKEIHEQPKVIRDTLGEYTKTAEQIVDLPAVRDKGIESILMVAAGTAYHAALVGKNIMEELMAVPVRVEAAHEFNYYTNVLSGTLAIAITQSGETSDTLKAIRRLKEAGSRVIVISNVVGSTATRIANQTIYTRAGPEISVAATKTFIAQLMVLYWLTMSYSKTDARRLAGLLMELRQLPNKVQQVLDSEDSIQEQARFISRYDNAYFIGRGLNYPVALEGALKLKEISYIHAEGYAAGELKHGPFALLGENTPVIAIVAKDSTYEPMMTNIKQVKARNSPLLAIVGDGEEDGNEAIEELADAVISVPKVDRVFTPVVNTVVLQLLAYYAAKERGCPIDYPRNLAKSVTVE
ncbi:glutamine--fructose-6-phosphate transaminase (isomerizing) [Chloroflexota bacterium]